MKKLLFGAIALGLLLVGGLGLAPAHAQTQLLPIPTGVCASATQLLAAYDTNNAQCKSAIIEVDVGINPAPVAANVCATYVTDLTGALTTDRVVIEPPAASTWIVTSARPGATAGSIAVDFCNVNTSTRGPPSGTFTVTLLRNR